MKTVKKQSWRGFRKVTAFWAMFAMLLGLIDPAFVMKVKAAMSYPVTVNFYAADQATLEAPNISAYDYNWTYHVVVSLKDKTTGEVVGWGFDNIDDINKATQTATVTQFWNMDTIDRGWGNYRNAWHAFNGGNDFSFSDYNISARIYYGLKPDYIDYWSSGVCYDDILKQQDTIEGYKFLSQTRNATPVKTEATSTGAVVNIAKDNGTNYKIRLNFSPKAYAIEEEDNVYVLTTVKHKAGNYTYYCDNLVTNGTNKTQDIAVTKWVDNNGNDLPSEKYSSSEESVSVKLVKVNSDVKKEDLNMNMILSHTKCYDIEEGGDVLGYTVSYAGLDRQFITAPGADQYTTTDYDVINLTKIVPTADYTFLSVLGNAVNYGVVSDSVLQCGHSETNMATKSYDADGNNLDPDLSGDGDTPVPGNFLIGEITGSNLRLGGNTPATAIVITSDTGKVTDDGSNTSVKVQKDKEDINDTVDQMIKDMQGVSAEMLTHSATIHPQIVNSKLQIDTTNFSDYATIYIDGDDYLSAIQTDSGVSINKKPNQLIVFNFRNSSEVTIGKIQVQTDSAAGYKNSNTDTGKFGNEQNTAADLVAQQVVWNMASVKTATTNIAGGIFLMPRTDSTINLGGTSCGWGISAGLTKLGQGGEFHFVYRGLKQDQTVELAAKKQVDGKIPSDEQVFLFGIEKYNAATKAFEVVKVTDPEDSNVKIPYVLKNNGNTVLFPVTEMTDGENIFRLYEIGKEESTPGAYEYDTTSYYGKFNANVVMVGATPVKIASAVTYYKTFDPATGALSNAVAKSNVVFKNSSKPNTFTLKKSVEGDKDSADPDFTMQLQILDGNEKRVTGDARTTASYAVEGIAGKTTLKFTDGLSDSFTMKKDGVVVLVLGDFEDDWVIQADESALPDGYVLQTTAAADRMASWKGGEVTIVNKYTAPKGSLTVTKNVTGDTTSTRYDSTKTYKVDVKFDTAGTYKVQVAGGAETNVTFKANTAKTYTLKAGESVKITEIPAGVKYTVTEQDLTTAYTDAGYAKGAITDLGTGSIVKDTDSVVTVGNTYTVPTGSVTIRKEVTGDTSNVSYDADTVYTVNVQFNESGTYDVKIGGTTTATDFTENENKPYDLKANETIEISKVPVGVKYTVTEADLSAALTDAGYAKGSITNNGKGTVATAGVTLTVGNTYTAPKGSLNITKSMTGTGYDTSKKYEVNVKFGSAGTYKVKVGTGAVKSETFAADTAKTYAIKAGESILITEVPVGVTYAVTENALSDADVAAGYATGTIDNATGSIAVAQTEVTVNNTYTAPVTGSMKITKKVTGDTTYPAYVSGTNYTVNVSFDTAGTYQVKKIDGTTESKAFAANTPESYPIQADKSIEITGIPIGVGYTVTEADLTPADLAAGYAKATVTNGEGTITSAGVLVEISVNNTYTSPKGSLKVTKNVTGDVSDANYDADKTYLIQISFDKAGTYDVTLGGTTTATAFTADGVKEFSLKSGESVLIKNVPTGVTYTVTEEDLTAAEKELGYNKGTISAGTGNITTTQTSVTVTNTYTAPITGGLKVTKNVTGDLSADEYDAAKTYTVNVSFSQDGNYKVTKSGTTTTTPFAADVAQTYKLANGESVEFDNLPLGVTYIVTEPDLDAADVALGYQKGEITNGTGSITAAKKTVTVNNTYTAPVKGKLTVTKKVTGDTTDATFDAAKKYKVEVGFDTAGSYQVTYQGATSTITFAANAAQTYQLKNGESVVIDKIPAGVNYTVTEADLDAADTAKGYAKAGVSGGTGAILGTPAVATVNNTYTAPATGSLKITKNVSGDTSALNYDASKTYEVKVTFDQTGTYDVKQGGTTTEFAFGAGTAQVFAIKSGETIEISKVPVGTGYTVEETDLSAADLAAGYAKGAISNATGTISTTPVTATVNNTYTKQTAELTLKKTVVNPDGATLPSSYKVAVKDADNRYAQDTAGNFGTTAHYFDVSTGDAGAVSVAGLEIGQVYEIEENEANAIITGYDLDVTGDVSVKIKMVAGGKTANVINTYHAIGSVPVKYSVVISKQAEGSTAELAGATLEVKSADGGDYQTSWVSNGSIRVLQLQPGKYTLTETDAPTGYAVADPVTFDVTVAGAVEIGGAAVTSNIVTMVDMRERFDVNISKQAVGGGAELANAKLEVKSADGGSYYETWISDGVNAKTLKLTSGKYTLTETQAPNNYEIAETIAFEVTADGKVLVGGAEVTANTVIMLDALKKKPISISKVDALNSAEIAGASLVLYRVKADNTLEELTNWISSATEVYTFTLDAGNYAIRETVAPEGYELVESLVKFNLGFDAAGNPVTTVTEGPGVYDAVQDRICFKDDPIKVIGGLTIQVVDEVTGAPVPGAVVEVTEPGGAVKEYTTDTNGQISEYVNSADLGVYSIKVKSVPVGYTVTVNEVQSATVIAGQVTEAIAKTNTNSGALTIQVLDKVTGAPVPNATVEVTEPTHSVKTYITDENGRVNSYMTKDGSGHYIAVVGTYRIRITSVPDGYSVDIGEIATVTVSLGKVTEHIAKIVTEDEDEDDDEEDTSSGVRSSSIDVYEETSTGTIKKSSAENTRKSGAENVVSLKTGEMHTATYMFGGSMMTLFMGAVAYVLSKRKKER